MLRNLLIPLDGTTVAERALPLAACIARDAGATITLLRVPVTGPGIGRFEPPAIVLEVFDRRHEHAEQYLTAVAARPELRDLPVEVAALEGSTATTILDAAATYDADLVAMASHGRSGLLHTLFGSVTEQVVRRTSIPVIVLRNHEHEAPVTTDRPLVVFAGLDGSKSAEAVLEPVFALLRVWARHAPARLRLVGVVPLASLTPPASPEGYLAAVTDRLRWQYPDVTIPIEYFAVPGEDFVASLKEAAAEVVAESASKPPLCFVAVATHGRQEASGLLLGSVAESLIRDSEMPLLIVHAAPSEAAFVPFDYPAPAPDHSIDHHVGAARHSMPFR